MSAKKRQHPPKLTRAEVEAVWDWLDTNRFLRDARPEHQPVTEKFQKALENMKRGRWYTPENQRLLRQLLAEMMALFPEETEVAQPPLADPLPDNLMEVPALLKRWLGQYIGELELIFEAEGPRKPKDDEDLPP